MPFRTYLQIPYSQRNEAKEFCRANRFARIEFDGVRKQWFYPGHGAPNALLSRFPLIEVVELDSNANFIGMVSLEQPLFAHPPTPEQEAFVHAEPSGAENVLIVRAFAGAAKTTSLKAYARARPSARFLYLAFGNANAKEARETFPPNTHCSTVHAMAHHWLPPELKKKVAGDVKADAIMRLLGYEQKPDQLAFATYLRTLLLGFWSSADFSPSAHHLGEFGAKLAGAAWALGAENIELMTAYAQRLWQMMINPEHPAPLTHEAYLKLYALTEPTWDYDYILLDEAQDTNPVTESLVFSQKTKKIIVGDPHQNIYAFRRARDILTPRTEAGCTCLHLSHSFRFGPQIAQLANIVLQDFKAETSEVVGRGADARVLAPDSGGWMLRRDGSFKSFTWIARSNPDLFNAAVETISIIEAYELITQKEGPRIAFVGTSERFGFSPFHAYKFGRLLDLARLAAGDRDKIFDPFIARFRNINELWNLVSDDKTSDPELVSAIRIYRRYQHRLPSLIHRITQRCVASDDPRVWVRFSTAHKSKGLEWPRVRLADDFSLVGAQEVNMVYVALTRAKRELELNSLLATHLDETGRAELISNYMPGTYLGKRSPFSWDQAITLYGGDPAKIRAAFAEKKKEAAAKQSPADGSLAGG